MSKSKGTLPSVPQTIEEMTMETYMGLPKWRKDSYARQKEILVQILGDRVQLLQNKDVPNAEKV